MNRNKEKRVLTIRENHLTHKATIPVRDLGHNLDFLAKCLIQGELLNLLTEGLLFLGAVDPMQANSYGPTLAHDLDDVPIAHSYYFAGEYGLGRGR
jgi:hypothetical protein